MMKAHWGNKAVVLDVGRVSASLHLVGHRDTSTKRKAQHRRKKLCFEVVRKQPALRSSEEKKSTPQSSP
jgi:hypothetical protein